MESPAPQVSFEDYVAMSGAAAALGYERMLATYRLTPTQWAQIGAHWNALIPTNPLYMQYGMLVEQEAARIRTGGPPKPIGAAAQQPYPQQSANPFGTPQQQAAFNREAAQVGNELSKAFDSFGSAMESLWTSAAMTVGSRVLVQWTDGRRYPGTVTSMQQGQVQVAFPDGRQIWVAQQYVTLT